MAVADKSILDNVKELVGIVPSETGFDEEIITHINTAFSTLQQLGVGPVEGFQIENKDAKWSEYLGNVMVLNMVKSYMKLRVRYLWDPPTTSFALTATKEEIREYEGRLNIAVETPPRDENNDSLF